ncbi:MAG: hypothetical protein UY87_C0007G0001, partial [Candidatus Peribacteria bacterium GW2011_GWC2_54_8]
AGNVAIRPIASEMFAGVSSWKSLLATVFELVIDTSWQIVLVSLILLLVAENQLLDSLIPKVTIVGTFLLVIMLGLVYHRELINWILQQRKFFRAILLPLQKYRKHPACRVRNERLFRMQRFSVPVPSDATPE